MSDLITRDQAAALLRYDPETGLFWRLSDRVNGKPERLAGGFDCNGYRRIGINGRLYKAARLAHLFMTGSWPTGDMDHINGVVSDNRWVNLRAVDRAENMRNQRRYRTNKSGVVGVYQCGKSGKWMAQVARGGRNIHLGTFEDFEAAVSARHLAAALVGFHPNHGRVIGGPPS